MRGISSEAGAVGMLRWLQLSPSEIDVYSALSSRPMTIKQLMKDTRLSERMLRTHLESLLRKNFVRREALDSRMKYLYYGNPHETIYYILVKKFNEFHARPAKGASEGVG